MGMLKKYIKKKAKERYKVYKSEKALTKKVRKEIRVEVLKRRLQEKKRLAIKLAGEREIMKYNAKRKLLKRPYSRGHTSFFAKPMKVSKKSPKLVKTRKKKRRKRKKK